MPGQSPDPDGLLEYSVVFTERSLNHMSERFQRVMRDISETLRDVYSAAAPAVVPGGGTYGMEAIARQFAGDRRCLVIRNGYFSYRWSQIFEAGGITGDVVVLKASPVADGRHAPWAPPPMDEVVAAVRAHAPDLVFAPHVDTSSGILLPDDYLRAVGEAVHERDGLFVLDCVASGGVRVDMREAGVDVLLTAPQKGWSAPPSAALVMLGEAAAGRLETTRSSSFACDLRRWRQIMRAYEDGGHAYHATLPTDALLAFRDAMLETVDVGLDEVERRQWELGRRVRALLADHGLPSVAAAGFEAPGVVVSYTDDPDVRTGRSFADAGLQVAAGVPLMCDEPEDFSTVRIGLFGLDKWTDVDGTVATLERALGRIAPAARAPDGAGARG
ncbi:MAG: aminotransferase class V-fold PLP-dependent enzyme [Gemmatimonadetes bacterium]|nr:alanine--glyoxylate aminotransferase family protein [Gemmatimonadota bacterium]NIQ54192.1 alanine--glyoxylate aminotransferase family protein [Gemmatimonadota bacterium]NIU74389.1 aminotransferase class V-fold PLP-dependent enzyme [Gammaproteobacteria bacterium]NIX44380.1 aminotransferase class V-fold PLP-dependent enzyme [Gemmatimonadota bacterium]NIY08599.1 aminotransferase class V-fold PLP-dependent enzyme [Gemmatimonadota bacterium]